MIIESAEYVLVQGLPVLVLQIDGREARISYDAKRTLRADGFVHLGPDFEDLLPEVKLPASEERGELVLRGCTSEPAVLALFDRFMTDLDGGTIAPGRLELGNAD